MNWKKWFGVVTLVAIALWWIPLPSFIGQYAKMFITLSAGITGVLVVFK